MSSASHPKLFFSLFRPADP